MPLRPFEFARSEGPVFIFPVAVGGGNCHPLNGDFFNARTSYNVGNIRMTGKCFLYYCGRS